VVGDAACEGDVLGHLETFGEGEDVFARRRRLHVVDAQVERGDLTDKGRFRSDRDAAGVVEQCRDDAAVDDAGVGIADQVLGVGNLAHGLAGLDVHDHQLQRGGVRHTC